VKIHHTDSTHLPRWKPQTVLRLAHYCFGANYPKRRARFSKLWGGKWNDDFPTEAAATSYMATLLQMLLPEAEDVPLYVTLTGLNGHASLGRVEVNELPLPQAAEFYASHGIPVFPLAPRSKQPLKASRGFYDAATGLEQIRRWWSEHPDANIGCALGEPSRRWLLDFDSRSGGLAVLADQFDGRSLDGAAIALTGGNGQHCYYAWTSDLAWLRCGEVTPGVEVKGSGGYSVLPPSVHPTTGNRYLWLSADDLDRFLKPQPAPDWLLRWLQERRKVRQMPPHAETTTAHKITQGRRNITLTSIAGMLRRYGADEAELYDLLVQVNSKLCEPPLDDDEVNRIARSVGRYEPRAENERPDAQRIFEQLDEGHYRLLAPGIAGQLEIDLLRHENGNLVGQLTVRCHLAECRATDGLLYLGNFSVSSARARMELAKLLTIRAGLSTAKANWLDVIEYFCQQILAAERQGEPAIVLADASLPEPDEAWNADGFPLLKRWAAILFGSGGALKSYLALWFLGRLAQQGVRSLYCDWELDEREHRKRLELLGLADQREIYYLRCLHPLTVECERIRKVVRERGCRYIVLDSILLACDGPPESAEIAGNYFRALRRLRVGSLSIAHNTKGGDDRMPFGSAFWHHAARMTWFITRAEQIGGEQVARVALFNRKPGFGPPPPPIAYEFQFLPGQTIIYRADCADIGEFAEHMTVAQRMAHALRQGPMTVQELAELLDAPEASIRSELHRKPDVFTRLPDGRVVLAKEGHNAC
jgi:hypothetical protein